MLTEGEEINKITTDKPQNPGRQEWGRKLGKMMKERKLKNQQEMEKEQTVEKFSLGSLVRFDYCLVASVIIIVGAVSVYYRHKRADIRPPIIEVKTRNQSFLTYNDFV